MNACSTHGFVFLDRDAGYVNLFEFKNAYLFSDSVKEYEKNIKVCKKRIKKLFEKNAPLSQINFEVQMLLLSKKLKNRNIKQCQSQDTNFNFKIQKS